MNLSKSGVREFTGELAQGGIDAVLHITRHDLEVKVSRSARRPSVKIVPRNQTEESLKIVRDTVIKQHGNRLSVFLPEPKDGMGGSTVMIGGGSSVINGVRYQGPVTIVDGVVHSGSSATMAMNSGVLVKVTLPASSSADINSISGDAEIEGALENLRFHSVSGDVEIDTVRTAVINTTSGDVELDAVLESGSVTTVSGDVEIEKYDGRSLSVNSVSGAVEVIAGSQASGVISVTTVSGGITTRNTKNRPDLRVRPSTISGNIRER